MSTFRIIYKPFDSPSEMCALIPACTVKQAITRFNAAGLKGVIFSIQDIDYVSPLLNN